MNRAWKRHAEWAILVSQFCMLRRATNRIVLAPDVSGTPFPEQPKQMRTVFADCGEPLSNQVLHHLVPAAIRCRLFGNALDTARRSGPSKTLEASGLPHSIQSVPPPVATLLLNFSTRGTSGVQQIKSHTTRCCKLVELSRLYALRILGG